MLGTKVEITLPKAEAGNWTTLDIAKPTTNDKPNVKKIESPSAQSPASNDNDSDVDLNDIEQVRGIKITNA